MNHDDLSTLNLLNAARTLALALLLTALTACGSSAPTAELVDARRVYNEASASEAAELTPDKLLTARQALDKAEAEHRDDPGSPGEAHLAYVASRRAAMAIAYGKIAQAEKTEQESNARYEAVLKEQAQGGAAKLAEAKGELASEQERRAEAERRAAAALQSLDQVAKVYEEQRGTVIALPGGVLFPSGGHELSPSARQALDKVAGALKEQPQDAKVVVEGYTDSRGTEDKNRELSQHRAEAVRDYLVTQGGMDASQIEAVGKGEESPIAPNDSPEGRATNRRVEIVVTNQASSFAQPGSAQNRFSITPRPISATSGSRP